MTLYPYHQYLSYLIPLYTHSHISGNSGIYLYIGTRVRETAKRRHLIGSRPPGGRIAIQGSLITKINLMIYQWVTAGDRSAMTSSRVRIWKNLRETCHLLSPVARTRGGWFTFQDRAFQEITAPLPRRIFPPVRFGNTP